MLKAAMSSLLPQSAGLPVSPSSHAPAHVPSREPLHRLVVDAHADINALLRVLEPFAVLGVTPLAIEGEVKDNMLMVQLEFMAQPEVAENLHRRITAMVMVRAACLSTTTPPSADQI